MNEQLQQAVASLITASLAAFDTGVSFLSEQIPDVVQQLLLWKAAESFVSFFFFGICMFLLAIAICTWQYKYWTTTIDFGSYKQMRIESEYAVFSIFNGFLVVPIIVGFINITNFTWLQIWLAPKIYLIEYAKVLLK